MQLPEPPRLGDGEELWRNYAAMLNVYIKDLRATFKTSSFQMVDAGNVGATEQDWIEVKVGSQTGYIRVFATK